MAPLRSALRPALIGAAISVAILAAHLGHASPLGLIQPGASGPSAAVVRHDFPSASMPPGLGHDGQQFYAIARQPMHVTAVATSLDRPRYRLQRPLLPVLAWLVHPSGGGSGLIAALFVVEVAALVLGGAAMGAIAHRRRAWFAALFALLPGAWVAARIGVADSLAASLVLATWALSLRRSPSSRRAAVATAVAAVLAKEAAAVGLLGLALSRRRWRLVLVPLIVAAGWWLLLRAMVPTTGAQVVEFAPPLWGLLASANRWWRHGRQLWAAGSLLVCAISVGAAVRWRPASRLVVLPSALLLLVLSPDVLGLDLNGTRAALLPTALALAALAAPRNVRMRRGNASVTADTWGYSRHIRPAGSLLTLREWPIDSSATLGSPAPPSSSRALS